MPDLRYHVISLISVFLALAIGVLLGTALADRGVISDQLQNEVTSIQKQLDRQRKLIAERDAKISTMQESVQGMSDTMITGELQGMNVALVYGPWANEEVAQSLQSTLSDAGANLTSFEQFPVPSLGEVTGPDDTDTQLLYTNLATDILDVPGSPNAPEVVVFLGGGAPPQGTTDASVDILTDAESAMFEAWLENGIRVVATETTETPRSQVPLFQDVGVPSVDNVDQVSGKAAVVRLADSFQDGSYGIKSTASEVFPPPAG